MISFLAGVLLVPPAGADGLAPQEKWVATFNGPGNWHDYPSAMAVDGSGNVYVTGDCHSKGNFDFDYTTIKYSPTGKQLWVRFYDGPGHQVDMSAAIAVDALSNVYITGTSMGTGTDCDIATIKYGSAGELIWVDRYNGPGNSWDGARAIAVDDASNIYVAGSSDASRPGCGFTTIKYSSTGKRLWVKSYRSGSRSDGAEGVAVDGSGNVYVMGESLENGHGGHSDFVTVKYGPAGKQLWVKRYNGSGKGWDHARAISVDGSGNVYVTGDSMDADSKYHFATIKYSPAGKRLWVKRYKGSGNSSADARAVAADGAGNIYVAGSSSCPETSSDFATIKYSSNGKRLWTKTYNGTGNGFDTVWAMAVDSPGNVYVTGPSLGSGTHNDIVTIMYNPIGQQLWVKRYDGPAKSDDSSRAIAVDGLGNVYVTGVSWSPDANWDVVTIKY